VRATAVGAMAGDLAKQAAVRGGKATASVETGRRTRAWDEGGGSVNPNLCAHCRAARAAFGGGPQNQASRRHEEWRCARRLRAAAIGREYGGGEWGAVGLVAMEAVNPSRIGGIGVG
jgi:hypothetical protein